MIGINRIDFRTDLLAPAQVLTTCQQTSGLLLLDECISIFDESDTWDAITHAGVHKRAFSIKGLGSNGVKFIGRSNDIDDLRYVDRLEIRLDH